MKYYQQDTIISCGPVVMQMVLHYYGKYYSEEVLTQKLKTNNDIGTSHKMMIDLATAEGLYVYVNEGSSLEEVASFVEKNIPVIVHFIEPDTDDGHYAVVVGVQKHKVVINDPWNGEKFKIAKTDFEKRWQSLDGRYVRWIMAVSDTDVHFGKQYLPQKA